MRITAHGFDYMYPLFQRKLLVNRICTETNIKSCEQRVRVNMQKTEAVLALLAADKYVSLVIRVSP